MRPTTRTSTEGGLPILAAISARLEAERARLCRMAASGDKGAVDWRRRAQAIRAEQLREALR